MVSAMRVVASSSRLPAATSSPSRSLRSSSLRLHASDRLSQGMSSRQHSYIIEYLHVIVGPRKGRRALGHKDFEKLQRAESALGGGGVAAIKEALEREREATRAIEAEIEANTYAPDHEMRTLKAKKLRLKDARTALERDLRAAETVEALGEGGSGGKVWRARDTETGEEVAVKVEDDVGTSALEKEYEMTKLVHAAAPKHFPSVRYFGKQNVMDRPSRVMVLDLLSGGSLEDLSQRVTLGTGFSRCTVSRLAMRLFSILEACHSVRVVHGDIKPENLLLTKRQGGEVQMVDFGEAVRFDDAYSATVDDAVSRDAWRGTMLFSSANVDSGSKITFRDDLESVIFTLAYLRTGRLPWNGVIDGADGVVDVRTLASVKRSIDTGMRLITPLGADELSSELDADDVVFFDACLRHARELTARAVPNYEWLARVARAYAAGCDERPYEWDAH